MDGTTLNRYLWTVQHITVTYGRYNTKQLPLDGKTVNSYLWTVQQLTVTFGRYNS